MKNPLLLLGVLLAAPLAAQDPPRAQETDSKALTVVMSVSGMT
jgi:hypothetical protein